MIDFFLDLFFVTTLISLAGLFVSFIYPPAAVFWSKKKTLGVALRGYAALLVASFLGFAIVGPYSVGHAEREAFPASAAVMELPAESAPAEAKIYLAPGSPGKTVELYMACTTREYFDQWNDAIAEDDIPALMDLGRKMRCIELKEGLPATVLAREWLGIVKIRVYAPDGSSAELWAYRGSVL